ncbi:MAG: hypothetical protein B7Z08_01815 [Sphingomonadales bacterium 32-68-7]|nr:MAG: hypothetical protein B7Z33_08010 [Sphingomonadales bacterium 12-68-11]OYX10246.1 MAG: hypothetical protein B7Z08_01815 [Sphingomonadales bacterium 32-68-7]
MAVLAGFALLLGAAAWTYPSRPAPKPAAASTVRPAERDRDLILYAAIAQRVAAGESYYRAAVTEQRARGFPVRPGAAVRLPTFAYVTAWLGTRGLAALGAALALAVLAAWWRRLGEEPGGPPRRIAALALIAFGAAMATRPAYAMLHEVWAGMLLALAFALHRPGRWTGAWLAAAAALAIREHAAPFVLLLAALAAWRRDGRELAAWCGLLLLFCAGLALHWRAVDALLVAGDRASPPWLVLRGLPGWTGNLVTSSLLHHLTGPLAAPLALLPLIGWAGWRSPAGLTGMLLHLGYGVLFMLAGRANNFYWAMLVTPTWFLGLAFAPMALRSLWRSARGA